ncbi:MAG: hypothetical protein L3J79_02285 [Candidatus Marinimicrobia bacterium]|nr:hypothetical protein [Candidatus Neomarinimicrobiota bacterium]
MKTLLIHALRSEAGIVKQHFPPPAKIPRQPELDQVELNHDHDLLRTGIGLKNTRTILNKLTDVSIYNRVIHWGVSGSLDDGLAVQSLVQCHRFLARDKEPIVLELFSDPALPEVKITPFFSSAEAVTDESSRNLIMGSGAGAVDMESYAVAEFCLIHQLPLLALRCISDRAGISAAKDFRRNYLQASHKLQNYLLNNLLKRPKIKA